MPNARPCPNCGSQPATGKHEENGCILAALIRVIHDREHYSERQLRDMHARCDVDALWSDLGPIIDDLADRKYEVEP